MTSRKPSKNKTVLIMAGGTGGHVYPGLAVAHTLYLRGYDIAWLGSVGGMEKELVATQSATMNIPIAYHDIAISGVRGKSKITLIAAPIKIAKAISSAKKIIRAVSPCLVIGMGGFVAGPGAFAAWRLKLPVIVHEQNAVAGTTNKLTRLFATKVLCAFPHVFNDAQVVGNPVRSDIEQIEPPEKRMTNRDGPIRILVLGGSRGAQFINALIPAAIAKVGSASALHIAHQAGKDKFEQTQKNYQQHNITADVVPFINDMADALAWADIAICRAGALTVSELTAAGVGAIFIPYPYAIGDHQTKNAEFMVANHAAVVHQQAALSPEIFAVQLNALLSNKEQILTMASNAKKAHVPHCAQTFATICEGVIND